MPTVHKAFKYKLDPTPEQERLLFWTLTRCRELYNAGLQERRDAWKMRRVSIGYYEQKAELPGVKEVRPEYKEIQAQVLQDVILRLDRAFKKFFQGVKNGEKVGYPRFKNERRYHSFTYPQYGNGASTDNGFLVLSKIGRVKVIWSRPLEGTPKTVTIRHEADGWYVAFACANVPCVHLEKTGNEVGIDMGLQSFLTTSEGEHVENPRWFRATERKVRWHNKQVSRRKPGSKRRKKAVKDLANVHQTVARQRLDYQHKAANKLILENDIIYHEDLQVRNMVRNRHLSKSISDAGWGQFLTILHHKAASAGREVYAVPAQYTSQDCSRCGTRVPKSLSVRTHVCPTCGLVMDRDENSGCEIKRRGQRLRGVPAMAGADNRASEVNRASPAF
jgi:putative transposase